MGGKRGGKALAQKGKIGAKFPVALRGTSLNTGNLQRKTGQGDKGGGSTQPKMCLKEARPLEARKEGKI